jgi:hypothetical protein
MAVNFVSYPAERKQIEDFENKTLRRTFGTKAECKKEREDTA